MFFKLEPFAQRLNQSYFMITDQADKNSLQDIYVSLPTAVLIGFYNSLNDRQQKNFAFVANQVMDAEAACSVLLQTAFAAKLDAAVQARTRTLNAEVDRLTLKNERLISEAEDANLELSAAVASLDSANTYVSELEDNISRLEAENKKLADEAMKQKAPYINFLLSLEATPFRNLDADILKQAAELLGYQPFW